MYILAVVWRCNPSLRKEGSGEKIGIARPPRILQTTEMPHEFTSSYFLLNAYSTRVVEDAQNSALKAVHKTRQS